jgi:hypothetical protein
MGLLTPKNKKGDKKTSSITNTQKNANQGSKFISKGKGGASVKKGMTGGSQRGS